MRNYNKPMNETHSLGLWEDCTATPIQGKPKGQINMMLSVLLNKTLHEVQDVGL